MVTCSSFWRQTLSSYTCRPCRLFIYFVSMGWNPRICKSLIGPFYHLTYRSRQTGFTHNFFLSITFFPFWTLTINKRTQWNLSVPVEDFKFQKIFSNAWDYLLPIQVNRLQQECFIAFELSLKGQEMSALGSPNPLLQTSHVFQALSQPNSLTTQNFSIFNGLPIARAVSIYFSSNLIMKSFPYCLPLGYLLFHSTLRAMKQCATIPTGRGPMASNQSYFAPPVQIRFLPF